MTKCRTGDICIICCTCASFRRCQASGVSAASAANKPFIVIRFCLGGRTSPPDLFIAATGFYKGASRRARLRRSANVPEVRTGTYPIAFHVVVLLVLPVPSRYAAYLLIMLTQKYMAGPGSECYAKRGGC